MLLQLGLGFSLSLIISLLAWRLRTLTSSGGIAALFVGGMIFGLGGLNWAVLLLAFFISSSALSRTARTYKQTVSDKFSKGSQRDWGQVLANGGLGSLCAFAHVFLPMEIWPWIVFLGAMAAVNADTWATELGVLQHKPPRLLTTGKVVPPGTSGAVSLLGTLASLAGALFVGSVAMLVSRSPLYETFAWKALIVSSLSGLGGSLFDSLLGATVQGIYYCPACQKETEKHPLHSCGTNTEHLRGWRWLNNDWVNFGASLFGAMTALMLWNAW